MLKEVKLDTISEIQAGLVLKRKEAKKESDIVKRYKLLTLKSFESDGWINDLFLDVFNASDVIEDKYLTRNGDVVLRLTPPYTAVTITSEFEGLVVPSLFSIVRTTDSDLLNSYLSIQLNSDDTKKEYLKSSYGATIPVIRMGQLKSTSITIPTLDEQNKIVSLIDLIIKEKQELQKLLDLKEVYYKEILKKIMGGK